MAGDLEIEAMAKVAEALGALDDEKARVRVLSWAQAKYLTTTSKEPQSRHEGVPPPPSHDGFGPKASRWLQQAGLTPEVIQQVFHSDGSGVSVIASNVPGKNTIERVSNCYLLEGVRNFLATDEPSISDTAARSLCDSAGCYDPSNHAKRVAKFDNKFTGDTSRGRVVTGPGLAAAASLIKEIATTN